MLLRRRGSLLLGLAGAIGLLFAACGSSTPSGAVHVSELDNDIGPVTANFVDRALDRAEDTQATVWILQLDTPGGLLSATDDIVQRIEAATVPVVVYVSPLGARAASAGTFITLAAHIAAMAPSTQIGAASPVGGGGEEIEGTLGKKVTNDAAADIRAIAQLRGRNADWAERAVREAISATAEEAVALNVVDLVARDLADLLAQIDGRDVELQPGGARATIRIAGAAIVETNMSFVENVLDVVVDPNIALLLLSLGALALLIEIVTPGLLGPGIFGVIALLLGFFALGSLDTNPAGIALLVVAFLLILAEVFVAGFGMFGIGGLIALFFGGLLLISDAPDAEKVSLWVLLSIVGVVAAAVLGLWLLVVGDRRKRRPTLSLAEQMGGREGVSQTGLSPAGTVQVSSELWSARSSGGPIGAGMPIRVVGAEGLSLIVEPAPERGPGSSDAAAEGAPPTERQGRTSGDAS